MRRVVPAALALLFTLLPGVASAHPLGNFTVNHYAQVSSGADRVEIHYVLDEAEIPTFQEDAPLTSNPEGFAQRRAESLASNLHVSVNGRPLSLKVMSQTLTLPPGAGGLPTLRLEVTYSATFDALSAPALLEVRDDNDANRIGWREIVAAPSTGVSDALRQYPEDLLNSPLNIRSLDLGIAPASASSPAPAAGATFSATTNTQAAGTASSAAADASVLPNASPLSAPGANPVLADLANADALTPAFLLFALGVAVVLGAAHALQPGHGKTIVAAYLVGSRGTPRHALFLGLTVTATHTAGVYALGLVTLVLSQYIVPERLYPILEAGSGLLVLGIGAWLLAQRGLAALGLRAEGHHHVHSVGGHSVGDRRWPEDQVHSGGNHIHSVEDNSMEIHHSMEDHPVENHPATRDHVHSMAAGHHHHGHGHDHMHQVGWRSLLALGVSGGLLPCPEALMVLLITIAAHRVLFGLLLIVAFSTGLASVLVGFGLLLVYAKSVFNRTNLSTGPLTKLLPLASALVITIAGSLITAQALPQVL